MLCFYSVQAEAKSRGQEDPQEREVGLGSNLVPTLLYKGLRIDHSRSRDTPYAFLSLLQLWVSTTSMLTLKD